MRGKTAKALKKVARLMSVEPGPLTWWEKAAHWFRRTYWWVTGMELLRWFYEPWTERRLYQDAKQEYRSHRCAQLTPRKRHKGTPRYTRRTQA